MPQFTPATIQTYIANHPIVPNPPGQVVNPPNRFLTISQVERINGAGYYKEQYNREIARRKVLYNSIRANRNPQHQIVLICDPTVGRRTMHWPCTPAEVIAIPDRHHWYNIGDDFGIREWRRDQLTLGQCMLGYLSALGAVECVNPNQFTRV